MKTIAIIGATGNMGSAIAESLSKKNNCRPSLMSNSRLDSMQLNPTNHEAQFQLVDRIENTSSIKDNHIKDRLKSVLALVAFLIICIWMLYWYTI